MKINGNAPDPSVSPAHVRQITVDRLGYCLRQGWADFVAAGGSSLLHGVVVSVVGIVIVLSTLLYWPILPGALSGFVLFGPVLATGLYALSRTRTRGDEPQTGDAVHAWKHSYRRLSPFGFLLISAGLAWVLVSVALFHFFVPVPIDGPVEFLKYVINQDDFYFLLWTVAGGLGTAILFAITVISVPMLFDRDVGTRSAILTSVRAVGENPLPMAVWAIIIAIFTVISILTLMLGFIVLYPLLGHASWHLYMELVGNDES